MLLVVFADQVSENFGVRLRTELVPGFGEPFLEPIVIFDDAVVNDGDFAGAVEVRMAVVVRGRTVRGPAGVSDSDASGRRLFDDELGQTFIDLAFAFADEKIGILQHSHPGAVVAAIFQAAQSFQKNWRSRFLPDVSNNSAHKWVPDKRFRVRYTTAAKPRESYNASASG
jgi:hypothetical protein